MMMMMKSSLPGLATDTTEITNFFIIFIFRRAHDSRIFGLNLEPGRIQVHPTRKVVCGYGWSWLFWEGKTRGGVVMVFFVWFFGCEDDWSK
jgi:hypothetical protein